MGGTAVTGSEGAAFGEERPSSIGPYRILAQIGEGGFGVVYEAEQTEPVRRRVALKIIKAGMDSASVVARFEAERQALAVMDHPCIAKVFDGGVTSAEAGSRPYFVMELVRGDPITVFCDREHLGIRDRVELFARVCDAVQHAHTKGVIHRDLKPSNILVAYDAEGRATPKVIDFGVAKALSQRLTERTIFTERGQLIGTPEYMSPEQAEMSGVDIDTRADVYSLGVVLYELLTGALPFAPEKLREAGYLEIQRIIREEKPARPSTRLVTELSKGGTGSRIVESRLTDARSLTSTLRRDLDWVVMRCLEKDRERRYDTANAVAMEVRRFLSGEAVLAGPPSVRYRVGKFVGRNRLAVATSAMIALLLVGGLVSMAVLHQRAEAERERAENEAEAARLAREEEETQREIAERTLAFLNDEVFGRLDPLRGGGASTTVKEMVDGAAGGIRERYEDRPALEHAVRQMLGTAYARLGLTEEAGVHLSRAEEIAGRLYGERSLERADALRVRALAVMWASEGATEEQLGWMREAASISEEILGAEDDRTLRDKGDVTWIEKQLSDRPYSDLDRPTLMMLAGYRGRGETPEQMLAVIEEMNRRVETLWHLGDREGTFELIHEFNEPIWSSEYEFVRERLPLGLAGYAAGMLNSGYPEVAEAVLLYAIGWGEENLEPDHPSTLVAIANMAYLAERLGRDEEVVRYAVDALEGNLRVYGEEHVNTLGVMRWLGGYLRKHERYDEAEAYYLEILRINMESKGDSHRDTADALSYLGVLEYRRGDARAAIAYFEEGLGVALRAGGERGDMTLLIRGNIATVRLENGEPMKAIAEVDELDRQLERAYDEGEADDLLDRVKNVISLLRDLHQLDEGGGYGERAALWRARVRELGGGSGDGD